MPMEIETRLKAASIYGVWYIDFSDYEKDSWVLQRDTGIRRHVGHKFEFRHNGEFSDEYFAPCGNDGGIHDWSGKWKIDEAGEVLFLQITQYDERVDTSLAEFVKPSEDYKTGVEFYIAERTEHMMRLRPKNTTAELWV